MEIIQLVCNESRVEDNQNIYGRFKLFPFLPGQAVTLVNGLRRCLLSEVSGIAITAIKIKGVTHEYSTIVGVRESVLDLLLNVKQVVLTSEFQFEQPQVAYLRVQGPGKVQASDIKLPMSIQNVKPEQYIATLLYDGVLDIKFIICRGKNSLVQTPRGLRTPKVLKTKLPHQFKVLKTKTNSIKFSRFLNQNFSTNSLLNLMTYQTAPRTFLKQRHKKKIKPYADLVFLCLETKLGGKKRSLNLLKSDRYLKKENKKPQINLLLPTAFLEAVVLPIDAVFAPVLRVNFAIEENDLSNAPKECVILEIWTNGSIHPIQAIVEAGKALTNITGLLKPITIAKSVFINSLKSFNNALNYNKILKKEEERFKSLLPSAYSYYDFRSCYAAIDNRYKIGGSYDKIFKVSQSKKESRAVLSKQHDYLRKRMYQQFKKVLKKKFKDRNINQQVLFKVLTTKFKPRVYRILGKKIKLSEKARKTAIKKMLVNNDHFDDTAYFNNLEKEKGNEPRYPKFLFLKEKGAIELLMRETPLIKAGKLKRIAWLLINSYITSHFLKMDKKYENLTKNVPEEIDFSVDIGILDFSLRSYTCLKKANIENLNDLLQNSAEDLLSIKGFGKKSLNEVENSLHRYHVKLKS